MVRKSAALVQCTARAPRRDFLLLPLLLTVQTHVLTSSNALRVRDRDRDRDRDRALARYGMEHLTGRVVLLWHSQIPLTLQDFLAFNRSQLENIMTLRMLPKVHNGKSFFKLEPFLRYTEIRRWP